MSNEHSFIEEFHSYIEEEEDNEDNNEKNDQETNIYNKMENNLNKVGDIIRTNLFINPTNKYLEIRDSFKSSENNLYLNTNLSSSNDCEQKITKFKENESAKTITEKQVSTNGKFLIYSFSFCFRKIRNDKRR